LSATIKNATGLTARVEAGMSGQFDVWLDGKLIFSRFEEGRFPEDDEILKLLK
jgi:selT/selW/selH-like putative selenoprotein